MTATDLTRAELRKLARIALATRSPWARDRLARAATGGALDMTALQGLSNRASDARTTLAAADPWALMWCGYVLLCEPGSDLRYATQLLSLASGLHESDSAAAFPSDVLDAWAVALVHTGQRAEATHLASVATLSETAEWAVQTDLENPYTFPDEAETRRWAELFSTPFTSSSLAAPRLPERSLPDSGMPIHGLSAPDALVGSVGGPLISVVVPTFTPSPDDLRMSLLSLVEQTWANLEVLLCDDATPAEGRDVINEVAGLDNRVRVIRLATNGGPYAARNAGLAEARGEFVTFHDSDDWSHPERLTRHAERLLSQPTLAAVLSRSVRATPTLQVAAIGVSATRPNLSSLMFRREETLRRLGAFDAVRRGADSEWIERLRSVYGDGAVETLGEHLSVVQLTDGSVSRGDFGANWMHPARQTYVRAYRWWHTSIRSGASPHVEAGSRIPTTAPSHLLGRPPEPLRADIGLLGDFRPASALRPDSGALLRSLASRAAPVIVIYATDPAEGVLTSIRPESAEASLSATGDVVALELGQSCDLSLLVVQNPDAVEVRDMAGAGLISCRRVALIADVGSPAVQDASEITRELGTLAEEVVWMPATTEVAAELRGALEDTAARVLNPEHVWSLLPDPCAAQRSTDISRVALDLTAVGPNWLKRGGSWTGPTMSAFPDVEWRSTDAIVEWPGGQRVPAGHLPRWWHGSAEELRSVDVAVLPIALRDRVRAHETRVIRCLNAGCLVITDPSHIPGLADAVLPLQDAGPSEILSRLRDDPLYAERTRITGIRLARRWGAGRDSESVAATLLSLTVGHASAAARNRSAGRWRPMFRG